MFLNWLFNHCRFLKRVFRSGNFHFCWRYFCFLVWSLFLWLGDFYFFFLIACIGASFFMLSTEKSKLGIGSFREKVCPRSNICLKRSKSYLERLISFSPDIIQRLFWIQILNIKSCLRIKLVCSVGVINFLNYRNPWQFSIQRGSILFENYVLCFCVV